MAKQDSIFRDIAIALAFGRIETPPAPYAQTEEEIQQDRALLERFRQEDEARRWKLLDGGVDAEIVATVFLRRDDVNAACHAMALHQMAPEMRVRVKDVRWVRVTDHGFDRIVDFVNDGGDRVAPPKAEDKPVD